MLNSWIGDFKAIRTCAREIWNYCNSYDASKGGNKHSKNFEKICDWVDDKIDDEGLLNLRDFKQQYIDITGSSSKDWGKLNKKIRTRFNLRSVCTIEEFTGSRSKSQKRHIWRGKKILIFSCSKNMNAFTTNTWENQAL